MKNLFCKSCGNKLGTDAMFCPYCGNQIADSISVTGFTNERFKLSAGLSKLNQEISDVKGRIHTDSEFASRDAVEYAGLPGCVMIILYILAIVGVVSKSIIGWGVAIAILLVICLIWSSHHKIKQMKNKLSELETEREKLETTFK